MVVFTGSQAIVLQKSQSGNKSAKQLANEQSAKRRTSRREHKAHAQKGKIVHAWGSTRLLESVCGTCDKAVGEQPTAGQHGKVHITDMLREKHHRRIQKVRFSSNHVRIITISI